MRTWGSLGGYRESFRGLLVKTVNTTLMMFFVLVGLVASINAAGTRKKRGRSVQVEAEDGGVGVGLGSTGSAAEGGGAGAAGAGAPVASKHLRTLNPDGTRGFSCDTDINQRALTDGLGFKAANLIELYNLCLKMGYDDVRVPAFKAISSQKILALLNLVGYDLTKSWPAVAALARHAQTAAGLAPTVVDALTTLREELGAAFDSLGEPRHAKKLEAWQGSLQIATFLQDFARKNLRLMVRSTGKEDTDTLANAGGNESVPNVEPALPELIQAIKVVVLSYFSEKSLRQRLGQKDETVFSDDVFVPVLFQEMIGEVAGGPVPTSGVMFTQDPEVGADSSVCIVQAAFGHGELVVNSLGAVDTFRVVGTQAGLPVVFPSICSKIDRLVPKNKQKGLEHVHNKQELVHQPALRKATVERLWRIGQAIQAHYGKPMDVEFVVQQNANGGDVIFLVQARPIVFRAYAPSEAPSYIHEEQDAVHGLTRVQGSIIGAAGGSVRVITAADQVIFARTIGDALTAYTEPGFNGDNIRAVIVGQMAPSTSHEATTFRGEGKPVICFSGWGQLKRELGDGKTLLIDVQQAQAMPIDRARCSDAWLRGIISPGWVSYPMPLGLSLMPSYFNTSYAMRGRTVSMSRPVLDVLKEIKNQAMNPALLVSPLHALQHAVLCQIKDHKVLIDSDQDLRRQSAVLFKAVNQICALIVACGHDKQRLFLIRELEAVVRQHGNDILSSNSVAILFGKVVNTEERLHRGMPAAVRSASKEVQDYYIQLMKVGDLIMSEELQPRWQEAVASIASDAQVVMLGRLAMLVGRLGVFDLLPVWLHTTCGNILLAPGPIDVARVDALLQEAEAQLRDDAPMLATLLAKKAALQAVNLGSFADASKYQAAWDDFTMGIIPYFVSPEFLNIFKRARQSAGAGAPAGGGAAAGSSSDAMEDIATDATKEPAGSITQMAACSLMTNFVNTFDLAIKAMKGGASWSPARFQVMLKSYRDVLYRWANGGFFNAGKDVLCPWDPLTFFEVGKHDKFPPFNEWINSVLEKPLFEASDRFLSPNINIGSFTLYSKVSPGSDFTVRPTTGEDVFSILHQSLMEFIAQLYQSEHIILPALVKKVCSAFREVISDKEFLSSFVDPSLLSSLQFDRVGCTFSPRIALSYNIPLRDHSLQLEFLFDKKSDTVVVELQFYGANESGRWDAVFETSLLKLIDAKMQGIMKEVCLLADGLSFRLAITGHTDIRVIKDIFSVVLMKSFDLSKSVANEFQFNTDLLKKHYDAFAAAIQSHLGPTADLEQRWSVVSLSIERCKSYIAAVSAGLQLEEALAFVVRLLRVAYPKTDERHYVYAHVKHLDIEIKKLIRALLDRGYGAADIVRAAGMIPPGREDLGVEVYKMLIAKHHGFEEALVYAERLETERHRLSYDLLCSLVLDAQGPFAQRIYEKALALAVRDQSVDLLGHLLCKGVGYAEFFLMLQDVDFKWSACFFSALEQLSDDAYEDQHVLLVEKISAYFKKYPYCFGSDLSFIAGTPKIFSSQQLMEFALRALGDGRNGGKSSAPKILEELVKRNFELDRVLQLLFDTFMRDEDARWDVGKVLINLVQAASGVIEAGVYATALRVAQVPFDTLRGQSLFDYRDIILLLIEDLIAKNYALPAVEEVVRNIMSLPGIPTNLRGQAVRLQRLIAMKRYQQGGVRGMLPSLGTYAKDLAKYYLGR